MYPERAVLGRQAPAPSDQSAGSCRGLDLVASCRQSNMNLLELVSGMSCDRWPSVTGHRSSTVTVDG